MAYLIGNNTVLNGLIIWLIQLTTERSYYMAYSSGIKTGNKTALLYGLFNWQQNGLIVWLIQLTTELPYYVGAGALIPYKRGDDDVGWFISYSHS